MFLLALSILYGVLFMTLLMLDYENYQHHPQANTYTKPKYGKESGVRLQRSFVLLRGLYVVDCQRDGAALKPSGRGESSNQPGPCYHENRADNVIILRLLAAPAHTAAVYTARVRD